MVIYAQCTSSKNNNNNKKNLKTGTDYVCFGWLLCNVVFQTASQFQTPLRSATNRFLVTYCCIAKRSVTLTYATHPWYLLKMRLLARQNIKARTVARRDLASLPTHQRIISITPKVAVATWIPAIILSCVHGTINWKEFIEIILVFMWVLFRPLLTCVSGWCYILSTTVQMGATCIPTYHVTWNWRVRDLVQHKCNATDSMHGS